MIGSYFLSKLFPEFFESEKSGGMLLFACTVISLIIANSFFGHLYASFWHTHLHFIYLNLSIEQWINDGLMTIFFLLVGLEIKRELYVGELASFKRSLLPIVAAIFGMITPALFYLIFNIGKPSASGFGIPMATDIAFVIGVMALFRDRVPMSLKIFITALAIIDDIGSVIVIGLFYSQKLSLMYLAMALGIYLILFLLNRFNVQKIIFYIIPGFFLWYVMLKSGIHPTISGILLAFVIPFKKNVQESPSLQLQHFLHKPVAFFILPLFALANTALFLAVDWKTLFINPISIGITTGLIIGKPLGIFLSVFALVKLKICQLPRDVNWQQMLGVSILGGIGFTMSIFITNLAFVNSGIIQNAKIIILISSFIAGLMGTFVLLYHGVLRRK